MSYIYGRLVILPYAHIFGWFHLYTLRGRSHVLDLVRVVSSDEWLGRVTNLRKVTQLCHRNFVGSWVQLVDGFLCWMLVGGSVGKTV